MPLDKLGLLIGVFSIILMVSCGSAYLFGTISRLYRAFRNGIHSIQKTQRDIAYLADYAREERRREKELEKAL